MQHEHQATMTVAGPEGDKPRTSANKFGLTCQSSEVASAHTGSDNPDESMGRAHREAGSAVVAYREAQC